MKSLLQALLLLSVWVLGWKCNETTVYKITHNDVMEKPEAACKLSRKIGRVRFSHGSYCF
jgi:hypothetical protein